MADEIISLESLRKLKEMTGDVSLDPIINGMVQLGETTKKIGDIISQVSPEIGERIKQMGEIAQQTAKSFGALGNAVTNIGKSVEEAFNKMIGYSTEYINKQVQAGRGVETLAKGLLLLEPAFGILPKGVDGMGQFGSAGYEAGQKITESFTGIKGVLSDIGVPQGMIDTMERMSEATDRAYAYQKGIIDIAVAQGQLNRIIDGGSLKAHGAAMEEMQNMTFQVAQRTGQTVESVTNLAVAMKRIPGAISESVRVGTEYKNQLEVTSQIATAFGQKQTDVAQKLDALYTATGIHGQEAYQAISVMYKAAADSKLRFEDFGSSVTSIAENFKMLGDNTMSATNVVKAFDTAFKDSNISPGAMKEVIAGMAAGVKEMDRGTQAFVSSQTGGPGGLAGAFEMELAMQEGRMDEVLQKTMQAMQSQFGGEVLTLKDAAQNPALAGEFYKQVQFLTQVSGLASTDREAYKILEAMKSGVTDMLAPIAEEESSGALLEVSNRGFEEQKRTTNELVRIHNQIARLNMLQAREYGEMNTEVSETVLGTHTRMEDTKTAGVGVRALATDGGKSLQSLAPGENLSNLVDSMYKQGMEFEILKNLIEGTKSVADTSGNSLGNIINLKSSQGEGAEGNALLSTPVGLPADFSPERQPSNMTGAGLPEGIEGLSTPVGYDMNPVTSRNNPFGDFLNGGEFPPIPVKNDVTVRLDLGPMFENKMIEIANEVYADNDKSRTRQMTSG